jgi:hypothetical protein
VKAFLVLILPIVRGGILLVVAIKILVLKGADLNILAIEVVGLAKDA